MIVDKTLQEFEHARTAELAGQPVHNPQESGTKVCLTLWVRPTKQIKDLVKTIQDKLIDLAPGTPPPPPPILEGRKNE